MKALCCVSTAVLGISLLAFAGEYIGFFQMLGIMGILAPVIGWSFAKSDICV